MHRRLFPALVLVLALSACDTRLEPPPLELDSRDSLVGAGKVVLVKNTSNETLTGLVVNVRSPAGEERTFNQDRLEGFASFEVGWKKLGGWEIPAGAQIRVKADGFARSVSGKIE